MRVTHFRAVFGLYDTTANADSVFYTETNQDFGNISLAKDDVEFPDYMTLEKDYSILDGTMPEMPDEWTAVYFSDMMSNETGDFAALGHYSFAGELYSDDSVGVL